MEEPMVFSFKDDAKLRTLVEQGRDYNLAHGVIMRSSDGQRHYHAPFTLFPSPVPRQHFEKIAKAQTVFNLLMHKVAHDHGFLAYSLQTTINVDSFTRNLWDIYNRTGSEGSHQPISLALNRSDYMTSTTNGDNDAVIKQVEFNTIASGSGGFSQKLCQYHKYALNLIGEQSKIKNIVDNRASDGLANAMIKAWKLYGNPSSVVLFLIHDHETAIFDQRLLEYSMHEADAKCTVIRKTLQELGERANLGKNKQLLIDGNEVAVVYQRSCYSPDHFTTAQDWEARLLIEKSHAIKCPSLHYHLAGTKKVQQVLAEPGVLERFLDDADDVELIRSLQAGMYSLDLNEQGDKNVEMAVDSPERYVLKPQREGGGNNTFGRDIVQKLDDLKNCQERAAYVLMERLFPIRFKNYIVKSGHAVSPQELISEIGIFGSLIGSADKVHHNAMHGYIFRTKTVGTNEGGIMSGSAALDSIYLV